MPAAAAPHPCLPSDLPHVTTYLLSDLHLSRHTPHLAAIAKAFFAGPARSAEAVYLLGDFWDVWLGDDDQSAFVRDIEGALRALADSGVAVYFMHGNRDFLVGKRFAARTGVQLLDDPHVAVIGGVKTLLGHGDRYCIDDHAYQRFRALSRTPQWQRPRLALPLWLRRWIAWRARRKSQALQAHHAAAGYIADVVEAACIEEMQRLGVRRLIHGHTHRPANHRLHLADGPGERIVLADWREQGEALAIAPDGCMQRIVLRPDPLASAI